jgi:serine/threonine-protein kinase
MPGFNIDADTWSVLNSLLDQALDLAPAERIPWVEALGAEYDALRPRLRDLISRGAELRTSRILGTALTFPDLPGEEGWCPAGAAPGDTVGPYRLIRKLGEGGMGTVWLAERSDGLIPRPVALKLPWGWWRRAALAERMAREREILATLDHPNIARLYDAGITAEGQPYLALEYVDGRRIDEFIAEGGLDLRRLLALFLQVTDAVAHAHSQLVVHRDLKPSNILVTAGGHARLLDFGIAKLLEHGEARETELTEQSGRALTPDYASPEQIAGAPIGTASDVYSLGVVLYELLTGVRPYRLTFDSRRALEEAILQTDPARPSEVVGERSIKTVLRGDLDWIVLKAMAKERDRRYVSAADFGADLRRFLRNEPVEASPPSAAYRMNKFVRRHRLAVSAAALLILALIAGTVGTTAGMVRARRAEASARAEAATAERYSDFLVGMFEAAAPEVSKGREIGAREMLDRGAARSRKELANEPLLEARLLATIGWVYTRLGLYSKARPTLDDAVALARGQGDRGKLDLAQALFRRGQDERYLNEPAKAESDDREALAILERVYGPNHVNVEPPVTELGLLFRMSDPEQALRLYRRSHDLLVAAHGESDGFAAVLLQNIGSIHLRARRYQEARDAYERALPLLKQRFGERDPHVARALGNLGFVYCNLGDYARAFEMAQHGLEVDASVSGSDHPDVGIALLNLARISDQVGDHRTALEQVDRAIGIFDGRFPPGHPQRIRAGNFKAGFLIEVRRLAEARKTLENPDAKEGLSVEAKLAHLEGLVILADIERLDRHLVKSEELARGVLVDPAVVSDRRLEADAHWAHAYALAMRSKAEEASTERIRALAIESALGQGVAFPGVFADAKYYLCAGDNARAIAILSDAVAKGFHDPIILNDPTFAVLRENPDFGPIAAAVTPHVSLPISGRE